jgi:hypothetical protein
LSISLILLFLDDSDDTDRDPHFDLEQAIFEADEDDGDLAEISEIPDPAMETLGGECPPMTSLAMHYWLAFVSTDLLLCSTNS